MNPSQDFILKKVSLFALLFLLISAASLNAGSEEKKLPDGLYRGIYHVHSEFSPDSKATLKQIITTAKKGALDFVVITDHNNRRAKLAYQNMGKPAPPLLIIGEEISTPYGHVIAIGVDETHGRSYDAEELIGWIHARGGYAMLAHPWCRKNPWKNWDVKGFDGLEVYNFTHSFYNKNRVITPLKTVLLNHRTFLRSHLPAEHSDLELWDQKLGERPMAGISAADAHLHVKILGMSLESLSLQFQSSTLYVYADRLEERAIVDALGKGRSVTVFESRGDGRHFKFSGAAADGKSYGPGDSFKYESPIQFSVETPFDAEIRLIRNGDVIQKESGQKISLEVTQNGTYRAEAYRSGKLWIITNPIYVKS